MPAQKNSIFEKSNKVLDGTTGIVYLLFVGRENYAANIQGLMTDALFSDKSNVNQVIAKLKENGKTFIVYKRSYRKKGSRGKQRDLYTANFMPIISTLNEFGVTYDKCKLEEALTYLSETSDYFPKFITNLYQIFIVRKMQWFQLLAMYFYFLSTALKSSEIIAYPMPTTFRIKKENITVLAKRNPCIAKEFADLSLQLNSPDKIFNPVFVKQMKQVTDNLESKDSDALNFIRLLNTLKDSGINDIDDLTERFSEINSLSGSIQKIQNKLKELEKVADDLQPKNDTV